MPSFFIDLNLDQIVYKINSLRKNYDVKKLYYMLPDGKETQAMRRNIYEDIKNRDVFECLMAYSDEMKRVRDFLAYSEEVSFAPQKAVLFVTAANSYIHAVELLCELEGKCKSEELSTLVEKVLEYVEENSFRQMKNLVFELFSEISSFEYRLILTRDNVTIKPEKAKGDYFTKIKRAFPNAQDIGFESPFGTRRGLSHMETEAYSQIAKEHGACIEKCKEFMINYKEFGLNDFWELEFELQLYLSFNIFERYMGANGFKFSTPLLAKNLSAEGVYDVALALTLFNHERPVVTNDVVMNSGEKFLVVTGPNQGGKTTFARSIGQMIYFTMMGLSVAAEKAAVPYFDGILTHFSVEESTETGQGKLKEELNRLAPMMRDKDKNCFVILNELFTTAATYDAGIMGNRVMKHFTENGCVGIYVTHIKELSLGEGVVSLVAVCDEKDYHKRLYKMVRKPADGIGYAGSLVEKYGLTYDSLIERFERLGLTEQ